jgi:hypothetical protein
VYRALRATAEILAFPKHELDPRDSRGSEHGRDGHTEGSKHTHGNWLSGVYAPNRSAAPSITATVTRDAMPNFMPRSDMPCAAYTHAATLHSHRYGPRDGTAAGGGARVL